MSTKKFNLIFSIACVIPFLFLIFPLYEIGNKATPIILGMPFSFFWVLLWVAVTFIAVAFLYDVDPNKDEEEEM
ncbi:DUF3311 domain-containing protein [Siminovitchia sp. FSL H7-0308]|uniref:DUF3311 domain-containing protein n=1 Tax=Siminovitchia thermophila TaxID=1245522 RepID=A0ABS2R6E9_9BACI|nr:DUF3311 domain-containing protein [Siminovitchia thermophila]MBM7715193.1 hypothetical protein [Siminovitchia thermophila]ONK24073.1 hypothetical protein BLX87_07485 [Bacillus sp. VT-16-64]